MDDSTIRFLFAALFVSFMAIRVYYHRKAQVEGGEFTYREKHLPAVNVLRRIGALIMLGAFVSYFLKPEWLAWASISLPLWARWLGLALGFGGILFIWWTQASLGKNFNTTLHARKDHTLVTHGPLSLDTASNVQRAVCIHSILAADLGQLGGRAAWTAGPDLCRFKPAGARRSDDDRAIWQPVP
jgi:protein-S-isoprenylcysteine O-methyltransferase Ste14